MPRVVGRRTPLQRRGPPASLSAGAALLVALSPAAQAAQAAASGPAPPSGARRGANSASSGERADRGAGRPPLPPSSAARAALHALASPRRAPAQAAGVDNGDASPAGGGRKRVRNLFGSRNEASAHDALLMMSAVASPPSGSDRATPGGGGARRASAPGSGARRGRVGFARCRRRKPLPEAAPPAAAGGATPSVGGSRDGGGSYVFRFDAAAAGEDAGLLIPPPPPPPSAAEALAAALRGASSGSGVVATAADAAAGAARVAAALQRCSRARRWARAEWHCPSLDAPFFGRSDFRDWLDHAGLGGIARLPRRDWRAVRAPLGAPRRLSLAFLRAEREALELQRATSREAYGRLQKAGGLGAPASAASSRSHALPAGVPPPLAVGARVLALHPRSRAVAAGAVLTVEPSRLRVQFDRWDLGVEFCADTAVAPLRAGATPASHYAAAAAAADPVGVASKMTSSALHADDDVAWAAGVMASGGRGRPSAAAGGARGTPSARALYSDSAPRHATLAAAPFAPASPLASRAALAAAAAAAERTETAAAMASLSLALDRKEALLCELRQMNAEAAQMQAAAAASAASGPRAGDDAFARAYAEVVLALKDANAAVEAGLTRLRGGQGGATPAAAGRAAGGGATPGGAARLVADSAADASKLVAEAAAAAAAEPSPSPALAPSPANASQQHRAAPAGPLVAAAVAALLVVRQLADAPGQLPAADVAAALSEAADALRPRAAANGPLFDALRESLQELTEQLTTVYAA